MEYNRAVELDKPRLIFFIHESHSITVKDVETGLGATKLQALKDKIGKARVAAFFKSPSDLRAHVVEALTALREELDAKEPGDAVASAVKQLHRITSIPAPPGPYIAHPYTLLQLRDLVGRQAELNALTDWVAKPGSETFAARLFCFVAIGGMGKSALAWHWWNEIAPQEMKPLAGRMWWSFYESDARLENFTARALAYLTGRPRAETEKIPMRDREDQLLGDPRSRAAPGRARRAGARAGRLRADGRRRTSPTMTSTRRQRTRSPAAPACPTRQRSPSSASAKLRQTADPRTGHFLRRLTQVRPRASSSPRDCFRYELQDFQRRAAGQARSLLFLPGLSDDDAVALSGAPAGISGARDALVPLFRSCRGPSAARAGAAPARSRATARRPRATSRSGEQRPPRTSIRSCCRWCSASQHSRSIALQGLWRQELARVLRTIAGFRMPAAYETWRRCSSVTDQATRPFTRTWPSTARWPNSITAGSWAGTGEANRYDLHPIVRGVVWQRSRTPPRSARRRTPPSSAHFEPMADTQVGNRSKLSADLTPAIERCP